MSEINLLPQDYLRGEARRTRVWREMLLVALVGVGLVGLSATARTHLALLEGALEAARNEAAMVEDQILQITRLMDEQERLIRRAKLQRVLSVPLPCTTIVATVTHLLPEAGVLNEISMATRSPEEPAVRQMLEGTIAPVSSVRSDRRPAYEWVRIELAGAGPTDHEVSNFTSALSDHPVFHEVKMTFSRAGRRQDSAVREFRIEMIALLDRDYDLAETPVQEVAHAH